MSEQDWDLDNETKKNIENAFKEIMRPAKNHTPITYVDPKTGKLVLVPRKAISPETSEQDITNKPDPGI